MSTKIYLPCDSGAVSVGADQVADAIILEAEKRNMDMELIRNGSRGMFWLEPLMEVETGRGRMGFGPVCASEVGEILDLLVKTDPETVKHEKALGLVEEIEYLKRQQRVTFSRVGIIDPLDIRDYMEHGGFKGLKKSMALGPEKTCEEVLASGLRGRGGAGFPAGIKWKTVAGQPTGQKYVCCNADEGDSGTFADRMLMEGDPFCLLEGMIIAAIATGASRGFIYVRSEYPAAIRTLKKAIRILEKNNWLGKNIAGSNHEFDIEVRRGAGSYVCGEESAMLESLEGKRGQVRSRPPIPAISGLFGKPTLVNNVLTLASVPVIMAKGAKAYETLGSDKSHGTQAFQLAGNIKRGGLVELAFGVSLRELVENFGGGTRTGKKFRCAQLGGPLGAYVDAKMLDVAMEYETLAQRGAMLGHGGITVFDEDVDMAEMARFAFEFCAIESCGKCTPCRIGSVRGKESIERLLTGKDKEKTLELIEDLCTTLEEGSLCAMGGLTPLPVRSAIRLFPEDFGLQNRTIPHETNP